MGGSVCAERVGSALSAALLSGSRVLHAKIRMFFNSGSCFEGPTGHILIPKEVTTRTRAWSRLFHPQELC